MDKAFAMQALGPENTLPGREGWAFEGDRPALVPIKLLGSCQIRILPYSLLLSSALLRLPQMRSSHLPENCGVSL